MKAMNIEVEFFNSSNYSLYFSLLPSPIHPLVRSHSFLIHTHTYIYTYTHTLSLSFSFSLSLSILISLSPSFFHSSCQYVVNPPDQVEVLKGVVLPLCDSNAFPQVEERERWKGRKRIEDIFKMQLEWEWEKKASIFFSANGCFSISCYL